MCSADQDIGTKQNERSAKHLRDVRMLKDLHGEKRIDEPTKRSVWTENMPALRFNVGVKRDVARYVEAVRVANLKVKQ